MFSSVRDCVSACQAGCPCTEFRLIALAQASGPLGRAATSQGVLLLVALFLILFAGLVVFPAVWSSDKERRKAALTVLDRTIRWRR
jgi:hypothetical protein